MISYFWARRNRSESAARAAAVTNRINEPNKATIEANIAEIRAKRGQLILNAILEDVISAGTSPARSCGGRRDGN